MKNNKQSSASCRTASHHPTTAITEKSSSLTNRKWLNTPLLTCNEVAEILRRPVSSIYWLVSTRKIIAVRDGRLIRFRPDDIERYVEAHLVTPTPQRRNLRSVGLMSNSISVVPTGSETGGVL